MTTSRGRICKRMYQAGVVHACVDSWLGHAQQQDPSWSQNTDVSRMANPDQCSRHSAAIPMSGTDHPTWYPTEPMLLLPSCRFGLYQRTRRGQRDIEETLAVSWDCRQGSRYWRGVESVQCRHLDS